MPAQTRPLGSTPSLRCKRRSLPVLAAILCAPTLAAILCALTLAGCATTPPAHDGDAPPPRSQPAARIGLRPEYRVFYDALVDYGDWTLIEPYGYVFRPRVDPLSWRPFQYGFWAPTDQFGWVWISSELFGWATYHYGRWLYDAYQGWVWVPGPDWGPAWVAWQMGDQYVGWAPLPPSRSSGWPDNIPGGPYVYAAIGQFAASDVQSRTIKLEQLGAAEASSLELVNNVAERDGVRVSLGPPLTRIERANGFPLTRVRLDDAVPQGSLGRGKSDAATPTGTLSAPHDAGGAAPATGTSMDALRRAATEAAREAGTFTGRSTAIPSRIPVVRPFGVPGMTPTSAAPAKPAPRTKAPADSSSH